MLDNYGEDEFEEGGDLPSPAPATTAPAPAQPVAVTPAPAAPVAAVAQPPAAVPVTEPKVDGWRQVFQNVNTHIYSIYIYIYYI